MSLQPEKGDACKGEVGSSSSKAESSLPSDPHLPNNRPVQKNRKRCWTCRSKLELVQQEVGKCRCGQWLPGGGGGGDCNSSWVYGAMWWVGVAMWWVYGATRYHIDNTWYLHVESVVVVSGAGLALHNHQCGTV